MRHWIAAGVALATTGCAAEPKSDDVKVSVAAKSTECQTAEHPVRVEFTNTARKPLLRYRYSVEMRRRGYSTIILDANYDSDKILPPGGRDMFCLPRLLSYVPSEYSAEFSDEVTRRLNEAPEAEREFSVAVFDTVFGQ